MDAGILSKIGFDLEVALANFVNFLIIFVLFKAFLFKPIQEIISERREKIQHGLAQAAQAEASLESAHEESEKVLKEARQKANTILAEARSHADEIAEKSAAEGKSTVSAMKERAELEIAQEKELMQQEVEKDMTHLVASLAEKVVQEKTR